MPAYIYWHNQYGSIREIEIIRVGNQWGFEIWANHTSWPVTLSNWMREQELFDTVEEAAMTALGDCYWT